MAPEIHKMKGYRGDQVDMFALGVIIFCMVTGNRPFGIANESDSFYKLLKDGKEDIFWFAHAKSMNNLEFFSNEFKELVTALLSPEGLFRPTIP